MKSLIQFFGRELSPRQHRLFLRWTGHLSFLVLAMLSLVFYRERMLHFDTANYAFQVIYHGDFYTGHERFISYIPQLLPLGLLAAGASLAVVLMGYSLAFILFYYLIYLVITHGFKNPVGGLLLALALTLTVRYKFYGPVGEVVIGIAIGALVLGWLSSPAYVRQGKRLIKILVALALSAIMLITHPFPMITLGLSWLLWEIYSGRWKLWHEWLVPLGWGLMWGLKLLRKGVGTSYEQERLDRINEATTVLGNLGDYYIWDRFVWYLNAHYTLTVILFAGLLVYLAWRGRWGLAILSALCFAALAGVVIVLHAYLSAPIYIMLDGYMSHLGFLMAVVFALVLGQKRQLGAVLILIVLLAFSLDRIRGMHRFFADREFLLLNIIDGNSEPEEPKLLAHMEAFDWERLWMPWAIGVETLMMSSLQDPEHPQTLYFQDYGQELDYLLDDEDLFLSLHYAPEDFWAEKLPVQVYLPPGRYKRIDLKGRY